MYEEFMSYIVKDIMEDSVLVQQNAIFTLKKAWRSGDDNNKNASVPALRFSSEIALLVEIIF